MATDDRDKRGSSAALALDYAFTILVPTTTERETREADCGQCDVVLRHLEQQRWSW